jgi:hypothetical protein
MSAKGSSIRGNFENIAEVRRYLASVHEAGMARRAALIELPALETAVQSRIDRLIGD